MLRTEAHGAAGGSEGLDPQLVGGTFVGLVRVGGEPDSQAEANSRGASCNQNHFLLHVAQQAAELH